MFVVCRFVCYIQYMGYATLVHLPPRARTADAVGHGSVFAVFSAFSGAVLVFAVESRSCVPPRLFRSQAAYAGGLA